MNIVGIYIPALGSAPLEKRTVDNGDISAYQKMVGGFIEAVHFFNHTATLYIAEEGKMMSLPYNERATVLLLAYSGVDQRDYVAGNAFLVGPANDSCYDTSVPDFYTNILIGE